jgi:hypothetical protein
MNAVLSDRTPRRRLDVRAEPLPDGSAVLYDPHRRMTYAITVTAAEVWEWCDGTHTVSAMIDSLARRYDAPEDVITRDVAALVERLSIEQLLM